MRDIESWLGELGLKRYTSAFLDAEIEVRDLKYLSDQDLVDLGLPMGPRKRITASISRLEPALISPSDTAQVADVDASAPPRPAERRHLTVMFVDLVGSTALADRIDPEEMRNVITLYQDITSEVIETHHGYVAKFMGDGVLCYFGWPQANEDDATRAVRAGLEIIQRVRQHKSPDGTHMATRVGIASGVVVVGDLIGTGAAQETAVVGTTPNLAARLQGIAEPNQVVLPDETVALLGNSFKLDALEMQNLKGIQDSVSAYAVVSEVSKMSKFEERQVGEISPIIGRDAELVSIDMYWNDAVSGAGRMVIVKGEAGIGKSRVVRAVQDRIEQQDHVCITLQCSPYHADSAFHPIIQNLILASEILPSDSASERLKKLQAFTNTGGEDLALFTALIGIDITGLIEVPELPPAQLRARTMDLLVQQILSFAQEKPVLVVLEDLHWMDPTSIELMELTLGAIANQRVMILATARPEFGHVFGKSALVHDIALTRLRRSQVAEIAQNVSGGNDLPDEVLEVIAERTDGIPLFVEELTKTMFDTGAISNAGEKPVLAGRPGEIRIPNSLQDSLMARLDRLHPLKEVAQIAACIGREFEHRLLSDILDLPKPRLDQSLQGLMEAGLIYQRGSSGEIKYHFKHALVRDAAYESMLKETRVVVHARILAALSEHKDPQCEVIAYHAEYAGETQSAIQLWTQSAENALERPAYDEAISHLKRAIELIMPEATLENMEALEQALDLRVRLGVSLFARRGYGATETRQAFEEALKLVDLIGETPLRFTVYSGIWVGRHVRAEHRENVEQANSLISLAHDSRENRMISGALRTAGVGCCMTARFTEAQRLLDKSLDHYDEADHQGSALVSGQDTAVTIYSYIAINLAVMGQTTRARKFIHKAIHSAESTDHPHSIVYAHFHIAMASLILGGEKEFVHHTAVGTKLADEHKLTLWSGFFRLCDTLVRLANRDMQAVADFWSTCKLMLEAEVRVFVPFLMIEAGVRVMEMDMVEEASSLAEQAASLIEDTGEEYAIARLFHLQGLIEKSLNNSNAAETQLKKAVSIADQQDATTWQLRAACDLANLLKAQGRCEDALKLLTPLLNGLGEENSGDDQLLAEKIKSSCGL